MNFQIGKNGINENVIQSLKNAFKNRKSVRISVLKSAAPNKESIQTMARELVTKMGGNFAFVIIGFTIILKRRAVLKK
jgi:RNA-binding protein YhbY